MGWFSDGKKEGELVEASSPRVVMIDESDDRDAELHLRVPMTINYPTAFEDTRMEAREAITRFAKHGGWTDTGLDDFIAAIVFEYVDQEFRG